MFKNNISFFYSRYSLFHFVNAIHSCHLTGKISKEEIVLFMQENEEDYRYLYSAYTYAGNFYCRVRF